MNTVFFKRLLKIISVAIIYYASARFGLLLALGHTNASPVWPPSGFAFAAILILGYRVWPGILIGAYAANVVVFLTNKAGDVHSVLLVSAFIAMGNTLEALAGHYLLNWFRSRQVLTRTRDFSFFFLSALLMCLVSCTVGATSLLEGNIIEWENYKSVWFTWWMGDVSGIIVLTPVLLSWWDFFKNKSTIKKSINFPVIFTILVVYLLAVFNGWLSYIPGNSSVYLLLIILIWCVFSIQQWQSSLLVILTATFSIWNTLQLKGPFIAHTQNESLLALQIFLCVVAITMMFLSTTLNERRQSETKLKNVNSNLEKARKELEGSMKVKENFLANMSHEIRTPMNAIVGFTELLGKTDIDAEQKEYIEAVKTSGENLLVIINDILDFSKIQSGKIIFEQTGMKLSVLMETVKTLMLPKSMKKNIQLRVHIDENVPDDLLGDPTRMSQILINLIDNAIKFTEKGEVKTNISLLSENDQMATFRFEVSDTGIGIPEDKRSSIFEGFTQVSNETTRKYGGTGLGLAIVKQLVELQQGNIILKNKPDGGTVFIFTLSFRKNLQPTPVKKYFPENNFLSQIQGINILLVEDNELNQLLVQKILSDFSNRPKIVANGKDAIRELEENNFDLILLDIQLPEMDGYKVSRYIRTQLPTVKSKIPIIAVTAHAMPGEAEKCYKAGMNGYLSKPFTKSALLEKIVYVMKNYRENRSE